MFQMPKRYDWLEEHLCFQVCHDENYSGGIRYCVGDRNIGKLIKILYRLAKDLPEWIIF